MRVHFDPFERSVMDFWYIDRYVFTAVIGSCVAQLVDVSRAVAIISANPASRIIETSVLVRCGPTATLCIWLLIGVAFEPQPFVSRFLNDPGQRNAGKRVIRVAAANIRVNAGEPDLSHALVSCLPLIACSLELTAFVPQYRIGMSCAHRRGKERNRRGPLSSLTFGSVILEEIGNG